VKRIAIKDFDHFVNHNEMFSHVDRIFGKSLFGMLGQKWRDMRATLSPIFTGSKMKSMFGLISSHIEDFMIHFERKAGKDGTKEIDALEIFSRFTADAISTSMLGFEGDCVANDDSKLFVFAKKMIDDFMGPRAIPKFICNGFFPKLYKFLDLQLISKETADFFRRAVVDVMNERDRTNTSRSDIIQLMLNVKKEANCKDVDLNNKTNTKNLKEFIADDEYWMAQGFIFFFGGFDTTSNLLQSATLELALNPEIQEELHREISEVIQSLDGKPVSYDILQNMKFLDMVVSEALRKHPPFTHMDRQCSKDYELDLGNGKFVSIKKGCLIFLPCYQLHRDPEYFPNPEKFDPYRFSDENKDSIVSGTYLPFGIGPRACIGK